VIAVWHDPAQRVLVGTIGAWELRQSAEARRGMAHVQLWEPTARVSIVTPSRATYGCFEARIDGVVVAARSWAALRRSLAGRAVDVPSLATMRAVERWFVLATESKTGRLLRMWWVA
jgi:hypothetical protein